MKKLKRNKEEEIVYNSGFEEFNNPYLQLSKEVIKKKRAHGSAAVNRNVDEKILQVLRTAVRKTKESSEMGLDYWFDLAECGESEEWKKKEWKELPIYEFVL